MQEERMEVDTDLQESEQAVAVVEKTMDVQTDPMPSVDTLDGVNGFANGAATIEQTRPQNDVAVVDDIERPATLSENAIDIDPSEVDEEVNEDDDDDDNELTEASDGSLPPKAMATGLRRGLRIGLP